LKPLRVSYRLTPLGSTLVPLAAAMYERVLSFGAEFVEYRVADTVRSGFELLVCLLA
jgi:DNA-binding HxlR family transcriptional regulator